MITVLIVNTFRGRRHRNDTGGAECDAYFRAFEESANKLVCRVVNSSPKFEPIVLVSCNNGLALSEQYCAHVLDSKNNVLPSITLIPEPTPKQHIGPTSLNFLADALGSLEVILPLNSRAHVIFLTSWHSSMNESCDNEDWSRVATEINSYFNGSAQNRMIQTCSFNLISSHTDHPILSSSYLDRVQQLFDTNDMDNALLFNDVLLSESSFMFILQTIVSFSFLPKSLTISMQPIGFSSIQDSNIMSISLFCDIRPSVWTKLEWWHEGLQSLKYRGSISLVELDVLTLGHAFYISPMSGHNNMSKLPFAALSENRSLFASICDHLSANDKGLLFECPVAIGKSSKSNQLHERWLFHCEPASEHDSVSPRREPWTTAVLQQLIPKEMILCPIIHTELSKIEQNRKHEVADGVAQFIGAFECAQLPSNHDSLFDLVGASLNVANYTYTSTWLCQYFSPLKPNSSFNNASFTSKLPPSSFGRTMEIEGNPHSSTSSEPPETGLLSGSIESENTSSTHPDVGNSENMNPLMKRGPWQNRPIPNKHPRLGLQKAHQQPGTLSWGGKLSNQGISKSESAPQFRPQRPGATPKGKLPLFYVKR